MFLLAIENADRRSVYYRTLVKWQDLNYFTEIRMVEISVCYCDVIVRRIIFI